MSPQSTHFHTNIATQTDKKSRPEDEKVYEEDKQHYQRSEEEKREEPPEMGLSSTAPEDVAEGRTPK
ncbi:MAG TPA: hypothetical protein VIF83_05775 [Gemmatimonadaceae bacterium]